MLRDTFLKFVFGCIQVWEQVWAFIGFMFTPLRPLIMSYLIKRAEADLKIQLVDHSTTEPNQIYLKDSTEFYKRCTRNLPSGACECYHEGIVEVDARNFIKHMPKTARWVAKDSYHYLSLMVNIQAGTYGWETAKHYDTGRLAHLIMHYASGLVNKLKTILFNFYKSSFLKQKSLQIVRIFNKSVFEDTGVVP